MFTMVNPDPFIVNGLDEMRDDVRNAYKMRMQLPGAFWLRDLAVFPQYRNFLRIGMRLIQFSIEQGFERGFQQIGGMVHDTNEKLLRYYQSIGAKVIDRIDVGTHPTYAPDSQWNLLVLTRENWKNTI
jgi:ribosomal protein S18 acetylase RimI-like enzyme